MGIFCEHVMKNGPDCLAGGQPPVVKAHHRIRCIRWVKLPERPRAYPALKGVLRSLYPAGWKLHANNLPMVLQCDSLFFSLSHIRQPFASLLSTSIEWT